MALAPSATRAQSAGNRRATDAPIPSQNFPATGDTVDVYRAALDLLYIDGSEKPKVIVVHRNAAPRTFGPCGQQCRGGERWAHQSAMDTSTIEAFASLPFVGRPNFRQFGYKIPLVFLTSKERYEMRNAGWAYDSAHPPRRSTNGQVPMLAELVRRYPGAWGMVGFTDVAFNRPHTEALLGIHHDCGETCRNNEVVFFRKLRGKWTAIERVPGEVDVRYLDGSVPYRGPIVRDSSHSELLVDRKGSPLRSDAQDAPGIYRAVLDSLYSFFDDRPRKVVISGQHARPPRVASLEIQGLDPSTLAAYNIVSVIGDRLRPFPLRAPTEILGVEARQRIANEELRRVREKWAAWEAAKKLNLANANTVPDLSAGEHSFWHVFRTLYPGAWGYVEVSRVGYNREHTQALVYTVHRCGGGCHNGATWFLTRTGQTWSIRKMVPQDEATGWGLDSLRYLGTGANPKMYRPRSARGVFTNAATGQPFPHLEVTVSHAGVTKKITTDSQGRYSLANLPVNEGISLSVECPVPGRTDRLSGASFGMSPGKDTTINIELDYRRCKHLNREHPLIAVRAKPSRTVFHSVSAEVADVYRAILDAIYPPGTPVKGPILMEAFSEEWCRYCFGIEAEVPRLIRQGVLDPSTEKSFAQALRDIVSVPEFSYRRKIKLVPIEDHWLRGDRGGYRWDEMKDAYPETNAVISFSGVGFNSKGTEALVEVRVDSAMKYGGETLLLRKTGAEWRFAVRHVNRGQTSGEWSGGKCEPTDAPAEPPGIPEVKTILGEFNITRVGASRDIRGETKALRVVLEPLKPNPKYDGAPVGNVRVLGATGAPDPRLEGELWVDKDSGEIVVTEQPAGAGDRRFLSDHYHILRTDGTNFFGSWWSGDEDDINPPRGYFCASPARSSRNGG